MALQAAVDFRNEFPMRLAVSEELFILTAFGGLYDIWNHRSSEGLNTHCELQLNVTFRCDSLQWEASNNLLWSANRR